MNKISERLLTMISSWTSSSIGAYNIREDGQCAGRQSTANILIESKITEPGLSIRILPRTKGESVYIPACVTHGNVDDLVYNDFFVGENADITVIAGCGVHTDDDSPARHNGVHRFFLQKGARVKYQERHIGTGQGNGMRTIDPMTEAELAEGALLEMDTVQIGGVDYTLRKTSAVLSAKARLLIRERILTEYNQQAKTDFEVLLNGKDSGTDLISRSVARGNSHQEYRSRIIGNTRCTGHSECDAIITEKGTVCASPELSANSPDASLIHEAAIGKIAGEQLLKLRTLGLTEQEAEAKIVKGFLR